MAMIRLRHDPLFEMYSVLNRENQGDYKVVMSNEVDMSSVERLRARYQAAGRARPSYTALVARAVALALQQHPHANRIPIRGLFRHRLYQASGANISVAVETPLPDGRQTAYVETLRGVEGLDLDAITHALTAIHAAPLARRRWEQLSGLLRWLPGRIAGLVASLPRWSINLWDRYRGDAVLISSPAKYGVDAVIASWPWPIGVSFGHVRPRVIAVDGRPEVRRSMHLVVSLDRRVIAGAPAARFVRCITDLLINAEKNLDVPRSSVCSDVRHASGSLSVPA